MNYIYRVTLAFMYYTDAALIVFLQYYFWSYMAAAILFFNPKSDTCRNAVALQQFSRSNCRSRKRRKNTYSCKKSGTSRFIDWNANVSSLC